MQSAILAAGHGTRIGQAVSGRTGLAVAGSEARSFMHPRQLQYLVTAGQLHPQLSISR